jgi:hypothetical protein
VVVVYRSEYEIFVKTICEYANVLYVLGIGSLALPLFTAVRNEVGFRLSGSQWVRRYWFVDSRRGSRAYECLGRVAWTPGMG